MLGCEKPANPCTGGDFMARPSGAAIRGLQDVSVRIFRDVAGNR